MYIIGCGGIRDNPDALPNVPLDDNRQTTTDRQAGDEREIMK